MWRLFICTRWRQISTPKAARHRTHLFETISNYLGTQVCMQCSTSADMYRHTEPPQRIVWHADMQVPGSPGSPGSPEHTYCGIPIAGCLCIRWFPSFCFPPILHGQSFFSRHTNRICEPLTEPHIPTHDLECGWPALSIRYHRTAGRAGRQT